MILLKFLVSFTLCCEFIRAAKILVVVPVPSISHQIVFRPLAHELARRGHDVTIITTDPAFPKGQSPANLTEIDLHDFSYKTWREIIMSDRTTGHANDVYQQHKANFPMISKIFEMQMMTDEVKKVIDPKTNKYDLLILEAIVQPTIVLSHVFKVPVISMYSLGGFLGHHDVIGAPSRPPLLYPVPLRQRLVNLTVWDKIRELYNGYILSNLFESIVQEDNKMLKRLFGADTPTISELNKNIDMLFLNVHPIWEFNRPMPPNAVYMGGIHQNSIKELPKNLKSFLDSSKNGVIYISYGTNVNPSMLPSEKIQHMIQALSELPYDVLWKWDTDEMPNQPKNVRISKWFPQSDLLKHPNIKLFITQGGLQSTDEAITAGVPLIGMPMLMDQWFNSEMYLYHKIGLRLDMADVTKEKFKHAINSIVIDDSYRRNIERLRSVMHDQPQPPLERAVWWTEHLLRHGSADHLKALTANLTWSEYLDLELLSVIGAGALFILISVICSMNFIHSFIRCALTNSGIKLKSN